MIAITDVLTDLARGLLRAFPPPVDIADGSSPVIAVPADPPLPPGLVRCPTCGTMQARLAHRLGVHFPGLTSTRPCPRSWP